MAAAVAAPLLSSPVEGADAEQLQVALDAAVDLAHEDDPRGAQALGGALRSQDPALRAQAATAHRLARRITPELVGALADPSGTVRVDAAAALCALARSLPAS
ncbi:MAG: hypothetical protein IPI49_11480 [Myxococcales bacterium]|nr:hypothetical protein [Myxococcales bacterium]